MKSVFEIKKEMSDIQVQITTNTELKKIHITRMKKRYSFLKMCASYIETQPTLEYLQKEKDRLNGRINTINSQYQPDQRLIDQGLRKEELAERKDYHKIMGTAKSKEQLRSINYLLS